MRTQKNDSANLTATLFIGGSMLFLLFLAFSWGNALLRDANIERQLMTFKRENTEMLKRNKFLSKDLEYLQSPQYRDKWAKQHQGLLQPGEKVLSIEFATYNKKQEEINTMLLQRELFLQRPKREQWKLLFFPEKQKNVKRKGI